MTWICVPEAAGLKIELVGPDSRRYPFSLCFCQRPQGSVSRADVTSFLHPDEMAYFDTLKYERRMHSYLLGRFAAKQAVARMFGKQRLESIRIASGVFNQPVVVHPQLGNIQVSITHSGCFGAAVAFSEAAPIGIDLEEITLDKVDVLAAQMTEAEQAVIRVLPYSELASYTLLWTAKEALSKILKTGLTVPFHLLELEKLESRHDGVVGLYVNFTQYAVFSLVSESYVCSIAYPKLTALQTDALANWLRNEVFASRR